MAKCKGRVEVQVINILEMNDPGIELGKKGITKPCECIEGECDDKECGCDTCPKYDTEQEIACMFCKGKYVVQYNKVDMNRWIGGVLIQNAFPYLNATDRELLKTKMCGGCFDSACTPPEIGE